jgi:hypothetical protein
VDVETARELLTFALCPHIKPFGHSKRSKTPPQCLGCYTRLLNGVEYLPDCKAAARAAADAALATLAPVLSFKNRPACDIDSLLIAPPPLRWP